MRVVIAEDNTAVADGLAHYLRRGGHEVAVAFDGEVALHHLQSGSIDLLILDYDLPKIHGAQVLQVVRTRPEHVPVLLFSALDDAEARLARRGLRVDAVAQVERWAHDGNVAQRQEALIRDPDRATAQLNRELRRANHSRADALGRFDDPIPQSLRAERGGDCSREIAAEISLIPIVVRTLVEVLRYTA